MLNAFANFVGGTTVYIGGALRDTHVDIRLLFEAGAAGLVVCVFLLWKIRTCDEVKPAFP